MEAVVLKRVCKTYRIGTNEIRAVDGVDLVIRARRFTVLSGPSGSGKTTLLNIIGCIDRPDSGHILVNGQAVQQMRDNALTDFRARHLGFVFQSFNLVPVLTAYENVEYPLRLTGMPREQRRARLEQLLEAVGLQNHAGHLPGQLSGGQQQRVAIARALATSPALVVADEPTANLDSRTGAAIVSLMRNMQRQFGVSLVFSSHDPNVVAMADEVVSVSDGRITDHRVLEAVP